MEPKNKISHWIEGDCISLHRDTCKWWVIAGVKGPCIIGTPVNELKIASVKVERMFPIVTIVQDNINYVVFLEDMGNTVCPVYGRVRRG